MYIVELLLKQTPLPMSVQKKTQEAADETYAMVLNALEKGEPVILKLSCDKQEGKKLSILASELAGVQVYEKSGGVSSSGKAAGFFAVANE